MPVVCLSAGFAAADALVVYLISLPADLFNSRFRFYSFSFTALHRCALCLFIALYCFCAPGCCLYFASCLSFCFFHFSIFLMVTFQCLSCCKFTSNFQFLATEFR